MADPIYLNESDEIQTYLVGKNPLNGAPEPVTGLTTLTAFYSATVGGTAINAALSRTMTERTGAPGLYYASISGAAKAANLVVGQAAYARITDRGGNFSVSRAVVVRQVRDPQSTTLPGTGIITIITPPPPPPPPPDLTDLVPFAVVIGDSAVVVSIGNTRQLAATVRNAAGGNLGLTVAWHTSDAAIATVSVSGLVTGIAEGSVSITATYLTLTSNAATVIVPAPVVLGSIYAERPRVFLNTAISNTPSTRSTITVASGGNVQAAFDAALPGDTIILDRSAIFPSAGLRISPRTGGNAGEWITVKLSAGSFLPEGTRLTPTDAATYHLPCLRLTGFGPLVFTQQSVEWNGTGKWRFIGIEFDVDPSVNQCGGIVLVGDSSPLQNTLAKVPTDFIFDRCWIHGHANLDARKALTLEGAREAVIDSTLNEIHSLFDSQALTGGNGPGPFKIVNNYLEAAAENLGFGGADPGIPGLVPADIEIRRNHITKNVSWRSTPAPGRVDEHGNPAYWLAKELVESKNSTRVLFEGNVLENSWVGGQLGWIMGLWSVNQGGSAAGQLCETSHWTVQYNVARNTASGFSITAKFDTVSPKSHHITVRHNAVIGLANATIGQSGAGVGFSLWDIEALVLENNTLLSAGDSPAISWAINPPPSNLTLNQIIRNNIIGGPAWYTLSTSAQGAAAWALVHGAGSAFQGNVIVSPTYPGLGGYIAENYYVLSFDAIGLAGGGSKATDVTATLADLTLSGASPHHHGGTDGLDCGADMAAIATAVTGVGGGF